MVEFRFEKDLPPVKLESQLSKSWPSGSGLKPQAGVGGREICTSLSIERLRRFAVLEIVRSISPRDFNVTCSSLILVRALAWARALPRFIDRFCSVLPRW